MKFFGQCFFFIGLVFIISIPLSYYYNRYIILTGDKTFLTVTNIYMNSDSIRTADLKYSCFGKDINKTINMSNNMDFFIGKNVNIYCSKDDPNIYIIDDFSNRYGQIFFLIPGFLMLFIGIFILKRISDRLKVIKLLKANGKILETKITFFGYNYNFKVSNRNPFYITSEYTDKITNKIYKFKSDYIRFEIDNKLNLGDNINVYVDNDNYEVYYIDTSFLTKKSAFKKIAELFKFI